MGPKRGHEKEAPEKKRQCGPNFTSLEDDLLADLVLKHRSILENKRTDAVSTGQKNEGWQNLALEFNSVSSNKREWNCLKSHYLNLKKTHKKIAAGDKVNRFLTGGGTASPSLSSTGEKILALVGDTVQPLFNPYDSDALYNSEQGSVEAGSNYDQENITNYDGFGIYETDADVEQLSEYVHVYSTLESESTTSGSQFGGNSGNGTPTAPTLANATMTGIRTNATATLDPNTDGSTPSTSTNGSTQNTTVNLPTATPSSKNTMKQWQNCWNARRRPTFTRNSTIESKVTAARNIASLALAKTEYYEEMLRLSAVESGHRIGIQDAEHAKKIEVLEMKRKYYEFKMSKKD